jgi:hypothetical protein
MKRFFGAFVCLIVCAGISVAQKGKAEPDYYPLGYSGDTWTGGVTAFYNKYRTLTFASGFYLPGRSLDGRCYAPARCRTPRHTRSTFSNYENQN